MQSDLDSFDAVMATPIEGLGARVGIRLRGDALRGLAFLGRDVAEKAPGSMAGRDVARQLDRYFEHGDGCFGLALELTGTPFQYRVWQALQNIPLGQTLTYGSLARQLGSSARAVANACRANPIPLVVPCHRVVAVQGLGGYMGAVDGEPVHLKAWLLGHEAGLTSMAAEYAEA